MNSGLNAADPGRGAFRSALLHQGLIAAALFVLLWLAWGASRGWVQARPGGGAAGRPEPGAAGCCGWGSG